MSKTNDWIATADHGTEGSPGSQYHRKWAAVRKAANGQYELHVRSIWGSNQGYLEEHGRIERRYRADTLDDLLRVGVSEIRQDSDFEDSGTFIAAIRDAIFDAQDALTAE